MNKISRWTAGVTFLFTLVFFGLTAFESNDESWSGWIGVTGVATTLSAVTFLVMVAARFLRGRRWLERGYSVLGRSSPIRLAGLLLISSATILSSFCVQVAQFVTLSLAFENCPNSSPDEIREIMLPLTRLATGHSWFIVLLLAAVCLASLVSLRRLPDRPVQRITVGLCAQGLVTWAAMFCFCFAGFTGPFSLHHGPKFEFPEFMTFFSGVFPATLALIVIPLIAALWPRTVPKP